MGIHYLVQARTADGVYHGDVLEDKRFRLRVLLRVSKRKAASTSSNGDAFFMGPLSE